MTVRWLGVMNLKMIINFSLNLKMIYKLGFVGLKNRQIVRRLEVRLFIIIIAPFQLVGFEILDIAVPIFFFVAVLVLDYWDLDMLDSPS